MYEPLNYSKINKAAGSYNPSMIKAYNNEAFNYWSRSLFQRASSILKFDLPDNWSGQIYDFFIYCLFRNGFVSIFNHDDYGISFQPCTLKGYNFYYQPTDVLISNPALTQSLELKIGEDCELLKLTPDYMGIFDIIEYYAEKLAVLDNAINTSLINLKFSYILGARNKAAAEALKKMLDRINKGEPAVIYDQMLLNDKTDKVEPFQFIQRDGLKNNYLTTDQLMDFQTIINQFDAEIGIPTVPYQKKERMVTDEANSKQLDATSRAQVWYNTLSSSIDVINKHFGTSIAVEMRYNIEETATEPVAEREAYNE